MKHACMVWVAAKHVLVKGVLVRALLFQSLRLLQVPRPQRLSTRFARVLF